MADTTRQMTSHCDFDNGTWIEGTSGRVAIVSCTRCGAVVTADPGSYRHLAWHIETDRKS